MTVLLTHPVKNSTTLFYPHPKLDGGMRVGSIKLKQFIVILTFPYPGW